jgi:hypothetical protein
MTGSIDATHAVKKCAGDLIGALARMPRRDAGEAHASLSPHHPNCAGLGEQTVRLSSILDAKGIPAGDVSYGVLQGYFSALGIGVSLRVGSLDKVNAVNRQIRQSLGDVVDSGWLASASAAVRAFVALDVRTMLAAAARRAAGWELAPELQALGLDEYAEALAAVYASGYIPYGWDGCFPHGCLRRAAVLVVDTPKHEGPQK